jgi:tetratricopeptide (TPR) repeat protein
MKHRAWFMLALALVLAGEVLAMDWTGLGAARRLQEEKRYDEAIRRLEEMAGRTTNDAEQFQYLQTAMEIAGSSLKNYDRARALADKIRDPASRDFAVLQLYWNFKRYDEALAHAQGKPIETWPVASRASAYNILGEINRMRKNNAAALENYARAAGLPAVAGTVRGSAAKAAGALYLEGGDRAKAEEMFRKALAISPAAFAWRCESLIALSDMLVRDNRAAEAVKLFESGRAANDANEHWKPRLLEAHARALLADGKKIKAIETYDALLKSGISAEWKARIDKELDKIAETMN